MFAFVLNRISLTYFLSYSWALYQSIIILLSLSILPQLFRFLLQVGKLIRIFVCQIVKMYQYLYQFRCHTLVILWDIGTSITKIFSFLPLFPNYHLIVLSHYNRRVKPAQFFGCGSWVAISSSALTIIIL